jgi:cytochrome c biogenesis protein CcmG/thiol:disulfide interchange protein DsbE
MLDIMRVARAARSKVRSWQSVSAEAIGPRVTRRASFALLIGLSFTAISSCASAPPMLPKGATNALIGHALPEFRGATLTGRAFDSAELRGRPAVIKFFAEYCVPCQRTLPEVERLHRARPDVAFVGVSEDDLAATATSIVSKYGLSFPVLHDASKELMLAFRIRELPATFVVDRHGVVR